MFICENCVDIDYRNPEEAEKQNIYFKLLVFISIMKT